VSGATRARVAVISGLVVLSYVMLVYLIFYLTYTPLDVDHVRGMQGRYFVIVLPVAAIFVATVMNRELPSTFPSAIATLGGYRGITHCVRRGSQLDVEQFLDRSPLLSKQAMSHG
jgi:hypothetical protein